jgi:hypothetical protein
MPADYPRLAVAVGSRWAEDTAAQQIKFGPPIHLPLEQLEPIHLPCGLSRPPRQLKRCADRLFVTTDTCGKGRQCAHAPCIGPFQPGVELVAWALVEAGEEGPHRLL